MEIAVVLFFPAILIGAIFLGALIYILYKLLKRKNKSAVKR